jgi:hypothetical protein
MVHAVVRFGQNVAQPDEDELPHTHALPGPMRFYELIDLAWDAYAVQHFY